MRRIKKQGGYTITETLIVLAVTSLMFSAIVIAFSGRQAKVEFTQAVRNYESFLEGVISDVKNGHYTSQGECRVTGPSEAPTVDQNTSADTGTSKDCIFIGKVLLPGDWNSGIPDVTDPTKISEFTLIGRRTTLGDNSTQKLTDSLTSTSPTIPGGTNNNYPSEAVHSSSFGLKLLRIRSLNSESVTHHRTEITSLERNYEVTGFGILHNITGLSGNDGPTRVYALPTRVVELGFENVNVEDVMIPAKDGIIMCFEGQNGQRAEITIGSSGGQTNIFSELDTSSTEGLCNE